MRTCIASMRKWGCCCLRAATCWRNSSYTGSMKMTEQQIIDLIAKGQHVPFDGTMADLVGRYIHLLATISDRISSDELAHMIVIATVLYQQGLQEFDPGAQ